MKAGMPARVVPIAGITSSRKSEMSVTMPFITSKTGVTTVSMKASMLDTMKAFTPSSALANQSLSCPIGSNTPAV